MNDIFSTIAAISTPPGRGGIAVLRISGGEALAVAESMFRPSNGRKPGDIPPRTAVYGELHDGGEVFDTGIAVYFKAPASYTGEDTVELSFHGGIYLASRVLETALKNGARSAEAGEFTRRAYINGKLSLTGAEAVIDAIDAENEMQLRLAGSQVRGRLSLETERLSEAARLLAASVGVSVDYPEEGLEPNSRPQLIEGTRALADGISALLSTYRAGRAAVRGIDTVIVGRPNAGKSSLFNSLAGEEKAIVTPTAGTTRDVLETVCDAGGARLLLHDTAGLRESEGIEAIGVERAIARLESAELVIAVFDASSPLTDEDYEIIDRLNTLKSELIVVLGKSDLPPSVACEAFRDSGRLTRQAEYVTLSALTGEGVDVLRRRIGELYGTGRLSASDGAVVTNARHAALLSRALEASERAYDALVAGEPEDIAALDLEETLSALGELDGRAVTESVVNEIFSRFCVGK